MSSSLIEFLHGEPFFVIPLQKLGPPLGLASISQTRNVFQGSMVVIVVGKGRNYFRWELVLGNLCSIPSPALYAIAVVSLPTWLRDRWHGTPSWKHSIRRRRHSHALCPGIRPSVASAKGYHSRSLPQSATLVAVDRGDHALPNRLTTALDSNVDKIRVKLWLAWSSEVMVDCDLFLCRKIQYVGA